MGTGTDRSRNDDDQCGGLPAHGDTFLLRRDAILCRRQLLELVRADSVPRKLTLFSAAEERRSRAATASSSRRSC